MTLPTSVMTTATDVYFVGARRTVEVPVPFAVTVTAVVAFAFTFPSQFTFPHFLCNSYMHASCCMLHFATGMVHFVGDILHGMRIFNGKCEWSVPVYGLARIRWKSDRKRIGTTTMMTTIVTTTATTTCTVSTTHTIRAV